MQAPPAQDQATHNAAMGFAAAAGEAVNRGGSMALGYLGYKAGKNVYEIGGDLQTSAFKGAGAAFRWWVWGTAWVMWMFTGAMYAFGWWASHFAVSNPGDPMVPVPSDAIARPDRLVADLPALPGRDLEPHHRLLTVPARVHLPTVQAAGLPGEVGADLAAVQPAHGLMDRDIIRYLTGLYFNMTTV